MFPHFQKLTIEAEGDFVLIDVVRIKCNGMFRLLVWKAVLTAHGEWTGRDEDHRSAIPS
jgi:hypothetical protein